MFKGCSCLDKGKLTCFQRDWFHIFMNNCTYFSLFFYMFCISSSGCFSPLWFSPARIQHSQPFHSSLMPRTCFIFCLLPCVLITKALQFRNSTLFYWMPTIYSLDLGEFDVFPNTGYWISFLLPPSPPHVAQFLQYHSWCLLQIVSYQKEGKRVNLAIFLWAFIIF